MGGRPSSYPGARAHGRRDGREIEGPLAVPNPIGNGHRNILQWKTLWSSVKNSNGNQTMHSNSFLGPLARQGRIAGHQSPLMAHRGQSRRFRAIFHHKMGQMTAPINKNPQWTANQGPMMAKNDRIHHLKAPPPQGAQFSIHGSRRIRARGLGMAGMPHRKQ